MNDTTRDGLIERIAELADQFACGAAGEPVVYALHGPMDFAEEIIDIVTAARDAEIAEALMQSEALSEFIKIQQRTAAENLGHVEHDWPAGYPDAQVVLMMNEAESGMRAALSHIGLHGDSDTGGQE